jgi:hypothetical protein
MERTSKKIGTNRKSVTAQMPNVIPNRNAAELDDLAIMDQLFSILSLEKQVSRAFERSGSKVDATVRAMVADLNTRVARFDRMLEKNDASHVAMAS